MRTVLIVEDEPMILMTVEDAFLAAGWNAVLAMTLADGLKQAQRPIALAVLDVSLNDGATSYPIADLLTARTVPIIFTTGYGKGGVDPRFHIWPILQKPFKERELLGIAQVHALPGDMGP